MAVINRGFGFGMLTWPLSSQLIDMKRLHKSATCVDPVVRSSDTFSPRLTPSRRLHVFQPQRGGLCCCNKDLRTYKFIHGSFFFILTCKESRCFWLHSDMAGCTEFKHLILCSFYIFIHIRAAWYTVSSEAQTRNHEDPQNVFVLFCFLLKSGSNQISNLQSFLSMSQIKHLWQTLKRSKQIPCLKTFDYMCWEKVSRCQIIRVHQLFLFSQRDFMENSSQICFPATF